MSGVYEWEEKPEGISWIDKLSAAQAAEQCRIWGLVPAATLEQNRIALKNAIRSGRNGEPSSAVVAGEDEKWMHLVRETAESVGTKVAEALRASRSTETSQPLNTPQVVYDLASRAPFCSGTDPAKLLKFINIMKQMVKLDLLEDKQILVALLHKTAGQLRELWSLAIHDNTRVVHLIQQVVGTFLPDRSRQMLLSESVYRVQGARESLADFLVSVREAAEILLPAGQDILEILLTGLNSQTRARLAGFPAPSSVSELLALAPRTEVIRRLELRDHIGSGASAQQYASQTFGSLAPGPSQFSRAHHGSVNGAWRQASRSGVPSWTPFNPGSARGRGEDRYSSRGDRPPVWRQAVGTRPEYRDHRNRGKPDLNGSRGRH